jgi:hypothetical protein
VEQATGRGGIPPSLVSLALTFVANYQAVDSLIKKSGSKDGAKQSAVTPPVSVASSCLFPFAAACSPGLLAAMKVTRYQSAKVRQHSMMAAVCVSAMRHLTLQAGRVQLQRVGGGSRIGIHVPRGSSSPIWWKSSHTHTHLRGPNPRETK